MDIEELDNGYLISYGAWGYFVEDNGVWNSLWLKGSDRHKEFLKNRKLLDRNDGHALSEEDKDNLRREMVSAMAKYRPDLVLIL